MRRAAIILSAAALAFAPLTARAQDVAQAKAFVATIYAAYAREPGPDYLDNQAGDVFSPALIDLLHREAAHTPKGEVGALDGDPFCNCQDYKITAVQVAIAAAGPDKARADVSFLNFGQKQVVTLDLVWSDGHWRVDDIHAEGMPSLVGLLKESLSAAPR